PAEVARGELAGAVLELSVRGLATRLLLLELGDHPAHPLALLGARHARRDRDDDLAALPEGGDGAGATSRASDLDLGLAGTHPLTLSRPTAWEGGPPSSPQGGLPPVDKQLRRRAERGITRLKASRALRWERHGPTATAAWDRRRTASCRCGPEANGDRHG